MGRRRARGCNGIQQGSTASRLTLKRSAEAFARVWHSAFSARSPAALSDLGEKPDKLAHRLLRERYSNYRKPLSQKRYEYSLRRESILSPDCSPHRSALLRLNESTCDGAEMARHRDLRDLSFGGCFHRAVVETPAEYRSQPRRVR